MQAGFAREPASWRGTPETTALYEVVRDNLETLFGAIDDGALAVRIPRHARTELLAYLDCGLLCRGFARLKCRGCSETRLVAFSCKGRGYAKRLVMRSREAPHRPNAMNIKPMASQRGVRNFA